MTATTRRVALFGGAFDPFHNGHLATISFLLGSSEVDEVVVIPCGDRPDKPCASSAQERLEMARIGVSSCFANDPRVRVSDAQVVGSAGYATVDLLAYFKKQLLGAELLVVIGSELVQDLPKWKDPEVLKERAHLLVVRRPGARAPEVPAGWRATVQAAPYEGEVEISSTELRERLKSGDSCVGLMPEQVAEYCKRKNMYK